MNDHITKPIEPDVLFQTLANWCPHGRLPPAAEYGVSDQANLGSDLVIAGIDCAAGLRRMGGNTEAYRRVLALFAARQSDGAERVRALATAGDWDGVATVAHSLKGVAANLGARELADSAAEIETLTRRGLFSSTALDALTTRLDAVVGAIRSALGAMPETGLVDGSPATDPGPYLAALASYLADADGDAPDYLLRHAEVFRAALGQERFARLQRQTNEFEFAAALATLERAS